MIALRQYNRFIHRAANNYMMIPSKFKIASMKQPFIRN